MNRVCLTGNLCQDVELKFTQSNKEVVTNCVAVPREYKNANGEYESDFINIIVWGQSATYFSRYAHKGDRVELCGRWQVRKYQDANGNTRTANECVVESIKAFSRQAKEESKEEGKVDKPSNYEPLDEGDDLPF